LLRGLGLLIAALFLGGLYYALPNTRVAVRDAAGAGLFAALGFLLMQKAFELYLSSFPSYTAVYGAFATLPVFLLWLYLSWAVVLLGGLVAATLPEFRRPAGKSVGAQAPD
jgi:membrane protein